MDEITYSVANDSDTDALAQLLVILFTIEKDFSPNLEKQLNGLHLLLQNNQTATIQVAKNSKGKVVGMVTAQLVISTAQGTASAWIEDMVVAPEYRGHGVGKTLLHHCLDWAKQKGATRAQLLVDIENKEALGYYEHLNWQATQLQARKILLTNSNTKS
jgi:GNAT superfamily N-acetyltransferase